MLSKPCGHCRHLYIPKKVGLGVIFCPTCTEKCEEASVHIREYMARSMSPPSPGKIATQLRIPAVFVAHLFRLGYFSKDKITSLYESKACAICGSALRPTDKVYCPSCDTVVATRMHAQYKQPSHYARSSSAGRSGSYHYGFGRSI